jgi:hypothetical protein
MLIDDYLPTPEQSVAVCSIVSAPADVVLHAVKTANIAGGFVPRFMTGARILPGRIKALVAGEPQPEATPPSISFGDITEGDEWVILDEDDRELAAGAIGRFWQSDFGWATPEAADFAAFEEPGYAKTGISLSVHPYGQRTLLVYESRTETTDPAARRRFARYWVVLAPFVRILMRSALAAITREAEAAVAHRDADMTSDLVTA